VTEELTIDIEKLIWWPPKKDKDPLEDMDFDFEE
jgi:hypothetical protein